MNAKTIEFEARGERYSLPNRWYLLSTEQYLFTLSLVESWLSGCISVAEAKLRYCCQVLDLDFLKIRGGDSIEILFDLSSYIDFIFEFIDGSFRVRQPLFASQFLPEIEIGRKKLIGYQVCTDGNMLSVGLSSRRFIDALSLLSNQMSEERQLLLVLTLYTEDVCSSIDLHGMSGELLSKLSEQDWKVVRAVIFQFSALAGYIFSLPHYEILKRSSNEKGNDEYNIGLESALYGLCSDGIGSAKEVERLPVLSFLDMMRRKLIEAVRMMNEANIKILDIADRTGLDIPTINKIIR